MAISKQQLAALIKQALDDDSDVVVNPAVARQNQANKIADAIEQYVIGRLVTVTGVTTGGSTAPGTITG